jgi:hypothetical protein
VMRFLTLLGVAMGLVSHVQVRLVGDYSLIRSKSVSSHPSGLENVSYIVVGK